MLGDVTVLPKDSETYANPSSGWKWSALLSAEQNARRTMKTVRSFMVRRKVAGCVTDLVAGSYHYLIKFDSTHQRIPPASVWPACSLPLPPCTPSLHQDGLLVFAYGAVFWVAAGRDPQLP